MTVDQICEDVYKTVQYRKELVNKIEELMSHKVLSLEEYLANYNK